MGKSRRFATRFPVCFSSEGLVINHDLFFYILNCGSKTVKAADGSSFHLPVKGTIMSLENNERLWSRRKKSDPYLFRSMWGKSAIDGSLSAIITEQGVINDANDVMVLKTSVRFVFFQLWHQKSCTVHISTI